ncbi:hypothetical protein SAAL107622_12650 [Lacicoccus alkaliphilus]|uniref:Uncharacterized protein n=1 Tax=Lacicoccus alkaliphilus DSM 16010 TaxID=1123231 RepID=A0A1M7IRJ6_9BACL|nr:hypothetical protein SAMN02745189_02137 [Salinicoccus alkaliphilus DSM 16010]
MSYSINDARADLYRIPSDINLYDRMIEVAVIITKSCASTSKKAICPSSSADFQWKFTLRVNTRHMILIF